MKIIVKSAGGLGNQMFIYSFGYAVSKELGVDFYLDTTCHDCKIDRTFELDNFNLIYDKRTSYDYKKSIINRALINKIRKRKMLGIKTKTYKENPERGFDQNVYYVSNDTYFIGFWQSESYFKKYRNDLINIFTPSCLRSNSFNNLAREMISCNSVSVHVRRGDYMGIGCNLDMKYYEMAINTISQRIKDPVYYIFSDDINYCKEYFSKKPHLHFEFPDYESDDRTLDDLLLMSKCKNNIIANSSFSWWGAWLNTDDHKVVVCPEFGMWTDGFYPSEWVKIKV